MDCPTEEKLIRGRLSGMPGVAGMQLNLMQRELTVQHSLASADGIAAALKKLDLDPIVTSDSLNPATGTGEQSRDLSGDYRISALKWGAIGVSGVTAVGAEVVAWTSGSDASWLVIALALTAIASGGLETLKTRYAPLAGWNGANLWADLPDGEAKYF